MGMQHDRKDNNDNNRSLAREKEMIDERDVTFILQKNDRASFKFINEWTPTQGEVGEVVLLSILTIDRGNRKNLL